ncbi:hypothetical protein [Microbulbifer sp. ALW1]|uniref:hypothetical protein n=1 Tax=Microbulbifer sp. (strain ALW1) TaxID=1516059 RepID=UPI0013599929|nr:hypothetical protein [Microbulbifer sp. ALW1]
MKKALLSFSFAALAIAGGKAAADTESATSDITLAIEPVIYIANVGAIDLTPDPAAPAAVSQADDYCVAGIGFSSYVINFTSDNGEFALSDGSGNKIDYTVGFDDVASSGGSPVYAPADYNTDYNTQSKADTSCSGTTENASFQISVAQADWQAQSTALDNGNQFTDTLTITVTTE